MTYFHISYKFYEKKNTEIFQFYWYAWYSNIYKICLIYNWINSNKTWRHAQDETYQERTFKLYDLFLATHTAKHDTWISASRMRQARRIFFFFFNIWTKETLLPVCHLFLIKVFTCCNYHGTSNPPSTIGVLYDLDNILFWNF